MTIIVPSACAIDVLHQRIEALRETIGPRHRIIIALAGAPGSGKSTIAAKLLSRLAVNGVHDIAVMPMVRLLSIPVIVRSTLTGNPGRFSSLQGRPGHL